MKIIKYLYAGTLSLALLLPLGCTKDFLNQTDTSKISEDALFNKPQDGIALVNAIYDSFQHDSQSYMLKSLFFNANFLAQDMYNWGADVAYNTYQFTPTFGALNAFWVNSYQGISRSNAAIPIIARMKERGVIPEALANRLTGEAYFLRGIYYYYMGVTFGGVPLELKTVTDDGLHPRNTQDEVFAAVAADMTTAAGLLPWPQDLPAADLGRATKGAAYGYLGSALMWLKKYDQAVTAFKQLDGRYQLMQNYLDIHEYNKQNNAESIFEVQFGAPGGSVFNFNAGNELHWMSSYGIPEEISGFGYSYANPLLYTSFEPGDTRKLATVIGPGDVHPSPLIQIKNYTKVVNGFAANDARYIGDDGKIINTMGTVSRPWVGGALPLRSGYYGMKYWRDPNVSGSAINPVDKLTHVMGDQNVTLLRYGEILLSLAEAQFRSGDVGGATANVQKVRNRAWSSSANPGIVAPASASGPDLINIILNEYRHELGDEMSLWYNLRRSGEHLNYIKKTFNVTIPSGHDILPVPAQQIASNPRLIQNPNY